MYSKIFNNWLQNATEDSDLTKELTEIKDKSEEISDRFYTELEFGTAGLRGIIGAGTNRMNVYTVGRASKALALYVKSVNSNENSLPILSEIGTPASISNRQATVISPI